MGVKVDSFAPSFFKKISFYSQFETFTFQATNFLRDAPIFSSVDVLVCVSL